MSLTEVELKALVSADGTKFIAEVAKIANSADKTKQNFSELKSMIASAFGVGAVIGFAKEMMHTAHELKNTAEATGISLNAMVALNTVATETGVGTERLTQIMGKLRNAQGEVIQGNEKTVKALSALNITQEEFVGLGVDELMALVAQKYKDAGEGAAAFNAVAEIFGTRVGPKVVQMLNKINADGLEKLKTDSKSAADGINDLAIAQERLNAAGNWFMQNTARGVNFVVDLVKMDMAVAKGDKNAVDILTHKKRGGKTGELSAEEIRSKDAAIMGAPVSDSTLNLQALEERQYDEWYKAYTTFQDKRREKEAQEEEKRQKEIERRYEEGERVHRHAMAQREEDRFNIQEIREGKGLGAVPSMQADALARIGGFIGGRNDASASKLDRQIEIQERIAEYTKQSAERDKREAISSGAILGDEQ